MDEVITTNFMKEVLELKEKGNGFFSQGNVTDAEVKYQEALIKLENITEDEQKLPLKIQLCSNLGACYLKMNAYNRTIEYCTEAITLDPKNVKSLIRRSKAKELLEKYEEAIEDIKKFLEIQPDSKEGKETLKKLEDILKEKQQKEMEKMTEQLKTLGNQFLGMFGMSTDNFAFEKNPETGGYSVNIKK